MIPTASGTRYYSPQLGQYIDAEEIENIWANLNTPNALDRHSANVYNIIVFLANLHTVLTVMELWADPTYNPPGLSWIERAIGWVVRIARGILIAVSLVIAVVAMIKKPTLIKFFVAIVGGTATTGLFVGGLSFQDGSASWCWGGWRV